MSTRTPLRVTDIHESDDTLQAAPSTAKNTTPMVLPEAEIEDNDDDGLYDYLGGQRKQDTLIDNDSGDLHSPITDPDCLDVATRNRVMLEMLLENEGRWKAEQRPDHIKCTISLLGVWSNHQNPTLRQTVTTRQSEWAGG
jgi:hypothetical protein